MSIEDFNDDIFATSVWATSLYPVIPEAMERQALDSPLLNRVQYLGTQGNYSQYKIDDIIQVKTVSQEYRTVQVKNWEAERSSHIKATLLSGGAAGLLGLIASTAAAPALCTAAAICCAVSAIFCFLSITNIVRDFHQINGWSSNPAEEIATKRQLAYKNGFGYAFEQNLKIQSDSGALLPQEVTYLYNKYIPTYLAQLSSELVQPYSNNWVSNFLKTNPLATAAMQYGLGQVPSRLEPVVKACEQFQTLIKNVKHDYEAMRTELKQNGRRVLNEYENCRQASLQPLQRVKEINIARAQDELNAYLRTNPNHEQQSIARINYDIAKQNQEYFYNQAAYPINDYYNALVAQTRMEVDGYLDRLDIGESMELTNLKPIIQQFLFQAQALWQDTTGNYLFNCAVPQYNTYIIQPVVVMSALPNFQQQVFMQPIPQTWNVVQQQQYHNYIQAVYVAQ